MSRSTAHRSFLALATLLVCLSFSLQLQGGEDTTKDLSLPSETAGAVGRLIKLTATCPTEVYWDVDESLAKEGEYYVDTSGKTIVLPCPKPGQYKVRALSVINSKLQKKVCLITISAVASSGPGNAGGAVPTLPTNPTIVPPTLPAPTTALMAKLAAAYKADLAANAGTEADKKKMSQIYKQGKFIAVNVRNKTADDVFSSMRDMAMALTLKDTTLKNTRQTIAEYIASKLTWEIESQLQQGQRETLAAILDEIFKALDGL